LGAAATYRTGLLSRRPDGETQKGHDPGCNRAERLAGPAAALGSSNTRHSGASADAPASI